MEGASKDNGLCFPPPSPDLPSALTLRPGQSQLPPCSAPRPLSDPANLALISLPPPPQLSARRHGIPPSVPAGTSGPSGGLPRLVVMAPPIPSATPDTPRPVPPQAPRPLHLTPNSSCPSLIGPPAPGHIYRNATQQNNPNQTNVPGKAASFQISGA